MRRAGRTGYGTAGAGGSVRWLERAAAARQHARMDTIVVRNQDAMGHGDRALGQQALGTCLQHHGVPPGVGKAADLHTIVRAQGRAAKGIAP